MLVILVGDGFMVYRYVKSDQRAHLKRAQLIVLQLHLSKVIQRN